jgi:hypothetical protein
VALPVFLLSGQGQNRLFKSHFVLPSLSRTCVADGDAPPGTLATATSSWVASLHRRFWPLTPEPYPLRFPSSLSLTSPVLWQRLAQIF